MDNVQIFYIYAENCEDCKAAWETIDYVVSNLSPEITCEIKEFAYDSKVALNIAINNDIEEIPAFIIGDTVFQGTDYDEKRIEEAILATK